jgi:hypothetical protein
MTLLSALELSELGARGLPLQDEPVVFHEYETYDRIESISLTRNRS